MLAKYFFVCYKIFINTSSNNSKLQRTLRTPFFYCNKRMKEGLKEENELVKIAQGHL